MRKKRSVTRPEQLALAAAKTEPATSERVTYRELRNTPGRVWERLANDELLTLVAEGEAKAIVIPVREGNTRAVIEAYRRGRAMMAIATIRRSARENGSSKMTLAEINAVIRETREQRHRAERGG